MWSTMPRLDICSFCQSFTVRTKTCPDCGMGFCAGCLGGGLCPSCEANQQRRDMFGDDYCEYTDDDED